MPAWTDSAIAAIRIGGAFSTDESTALAGMLDAAEAAVVAFLGYDPSEGGSVTKYFTGDGTDRLVVDVAMTSVTNVWEDRGGYFGIPSDSFHATETLLTAGTDYVLGNEGGKLTGVLWRIASVWPYTTDRQPTRLSSELAPCLGCVKVTYVKRVGPNPAVIEGTYALAASYWSARVNGMGTINSASMDGASYSVSPFAGGGESQPILFSPAAEMMLRPFRRYAIARM